MAAISDKKSLYLEVAPNLFVSQSYESFIHRVLEDLSTLATRPVGKRLIEKIGKGSHPIEIDPGAISRATPKDLPRAMLRGVGTGTLIHYLLVDHAYVDLRGKQAKAPSFMALAHELIHALHNSYGKNATNNKRFDGWTDDEEVHTIQGFPSKKPRRDKPKITENAILDEWGLPARFTHHGCERHFSLSVSPEQVTLQKTRSAAWGVFRPNSPAPLAQIQTQCSLKR